MLFYQTVRRGGSGLSLTIASLLALPILWVAGSVLQPAGDTWRHLAATVLPLYVANTAGDSLSVVLTTVSVGDAPNWLTFSPDGKHAYSANAGANSITIVNCETRMALKEIKVGPVPKRLLEVHPPRL